MATSRRQFLQLSAAASGAVGLGLVRPAMAGLTGITKSPSPMRILFLGGTKFLGPPAVEYALARGHSVSLFTRGKTNPELFGDDVEKLVGDRDNDLKALEGREWDAVIDNSASLPRWVRQSAGLLAGHAKYYLFTSSISVFADFSKPGMDESAPVGTIDDPTTEQITGETYGPLKALCEEEARKAFGDNAIVVRPGLIVGPMDPSDRFTYWPVRIDRGGEVLAPGNPGDPLQIIDARDLGTWYIRLLEQGHTGTFNATGPESPLSIAEMLYGIRAVTSGPISFTWVDADFLAAHEVQAWMQMTVWVPPTEGYEGFGSVDCSRAITNGLTFRPLADTTRDTIEWWNGLDAERRAKPRAGLPAEKEIEVLAAWHARDRAPKTEAPAVESDGT